MILPLHITFSSLCFFLLLSICFVDSLLNDVCYSDVDIRSKLSNSTPDFQIYTATPECIQRMDSERSHLSEPSNCPPGLLSVDLSPIASTHSLDTLPHMQLNISVMAHSEVSHIFVRLHCVYAPDGEDVYCHDATRMLVNGVWRWPCRGVTVDVDQVDVPLVFGYSCFRLFGLSQYLVNVTVFPQNCRKTLLLTSPQETQLFPSIAKFYGAKNSTFHWSPVLFVDLSESDGVWFRVSYPKELSARSMKITVFGMSPEEKASRNVDTFEIVLPHTGVKWMNAAQGSYMAYAYIQRHDCALICEPEDKNCVVCVHTHVNFTLPEDIATLSWKGLRRIRDSGAGMVILVLAVCVLLVLIVSAVVYLRHRLVKPRLTDLELRDLKNVHIIYSDDCEEHSHVILEITRLLEASHTVRVSLDQRDLLVAGSRPSTWLVNCMRNADCVLLVVSSCTEGLLNGRELQSRRPYPDMFKAAYDILLSDWAQSVNRSRFGLVMLPYSPPIPYQLNVLNLDVFTAPERLGELFLFIQGHERNPAPVLDVSPVVMAPLRAAIEAAKTTIERAENWPEARFLSKSATREEPNVQLLEKKPKTLEEQALLAEETGLVPPDLEEEVEETTAFTSKLELVSMGSISSTDSDSD